MGDLGKVAKKAVSDPLGAAKDLIGGILGGGPSKNTIASREAREWGHRALFQHDASVIPLLRDAMTSSRYPAKRRVAREYLTQLAAGLVTGYPEARVWPDVQAAAQQALSETPWVATTGSAPDAGPPSAPASTPATPSPRGGTAPSAPSEPASSPRPPRPCKYGPRGADGYCPKKPAGGTAPWGLTGATPVKKQRPCKYGPRGADGYCPPKPPSSRLTRGQSAATRKAAAVAEKVVTAGVVGAGKAISAGLKAAGVTGAAALGTVLAVAGAALGGWFVGQGINEILDGNTVEAVKARAATRANQARRALAQQLGVYDPNKPGVGLKAEQLAVITKAFKDSIAAIERTGRDSAYAERVRAAYAAGKTTQDIS